MINPIKNIKLFFLILEKKSIINLNHNLQEIAEIPKKEQEEFINKLAEKWS